jgi:hypothetical protein
VWKRPGLSLRDRSVVTLAALIGRTQTIALSDHLKLALGHGVKPAEISEIITHLAFHSGWANAISASAPPLRMYLPNATSTRTRRAPRRINFYCCGANQLAVRVEGVEHISFVEQHIGLSPFQRVVSNEERSLHCAVISPEPHSLPCGIVTAAGIWKA